MIKKIIDLNLNTEKSVMNIIVELNKCSKNVKIVIRRFIEDQKLVTIEPYKIDAIINENIVSCSINLHEFMDRINITENQIFECYLNIDDTEYEIPVDENHNNFKFQYILLKNNLLYKIKPYISSRNRICLFVNNVSITASMNKLEVYENYCTFKGNIKINEDSNIIDLSKIEFNIIAKKRLQKNLYEYGYFYSCKLQMDTEGSFYTKEFDLNNILLNNDKQNDIYFDLFIEMKSNNNTSLIPIEFIDINNKSYNINNKLLDIEIFRNSKKYLSIKIKSKPIIVQASKLIQIDKNIELDIDLNQSNIREILRRGKVYFVCKKRKEICGDIEYYDVFKEEIVISNIEDLSVKLKYNFEEVTPVFQMKENDVYDLYIRFEIENIGLVDVPLRASRSIENIKNEYVIIGNKEKNFKIKSYINGLKNISLYAIYNNNFNENVINIGVLGSCFSRLAFTSSKFYNPKYKELYKVVQTDFHSSIISIVSNPTEIDINKIDNLKENNKNFIVNDFNKSFFDRLNRSKAKYILLDFYADAAREVIYFNDDRCVSGSLDLRKTKFYKDLKDVYILDHSNNEKYFDVWKDSLPKFMNRLKQIIPEENIILVKSNFIDRYKDKDNNIREFKDIGKIKRNMYFFDKLNNYYMENYPNSPIIDLTKTPYVGIYNHPLGNTYSHYESEYYKLLLNKLNNIIIKDFIKQKSKQEQI